MHKRPQVMERRHTKSAAKWLAAPAAVLALMGCPNEELAPLAPCTVSGVAADVPVTGVDKVDLLFMIDNSGSMAQEQAKLAVQLPKLLRILTTGEKENGEKFTPVRDLHVGVVTSDMGVSGSSTPLKPTCSGFGDDGKLIKESIAGGSGCDSLNVSAGYLNFVPGEADSEAQREAELEDVIDKFTCLADVGIGGCGFEQQLEAVYKATAPDTVEFTSGKAGHANGANKGFLRPEAVLAIIHVTDEEDCSVTDDGKVLFDEDTNDPGVADPATKDPLGLNIRCAFNTSTEKRTTQAEDEGFVYPVTRYFEEFKDKVKPLNKDRIVFAAIAGISEADENKSFDEMLENPRMAFKVDPNGLSNDVTNINASAQDVCRRCETLDEAECFAEPLNLRDADGDITGPNPEIITGAKPAVRFVKVAKGFGENGLVTSICAESFAPAVDKIIEKISKQLTGACLPRELNPNSDGIVECDVVEVLGPSGEQSDCDSKRGRRFKEMRQVGDSVRVVCDINQVAVQGTDLVTNPTPLDGTSGDVGWYYDTFSEKVTMECPEDRQRRISFSDPSAEPKDATLRFECFQPVVSSDTETLGKEAVNSPCTSDEDCQERTDGFYNLTCDDDVNTCQITCGQDSECPPSWVCNTERQLCINPTCPPPNLR